MLITRSLFCHSAGSSFWTLHFAFLTCHFALSLPHWCQRGETFALTHHLVVQIISSRKMFRLLYNLQWPT